MSHSITEKYNGNLLRPHSKKEKEFLKKAISINKQGNLFCCYDFDESRCNFRQILFRLRDEIECVIPSRPSFYKVKGLECNGRILDHLTLKGMEVGNKMEKILESVIKQPPAIHDIKLKFNHDKLYNHLVNLENKVNPKNGGILFPRVDVNDHVTLSYIVYPKTVIVDIGCTYKPIIYDNRGALQLIQILERVRTALEVDTDGIITDIPNPLDWIITQYHFNQDGLEEYSGYPFNVSVDDFSAGFIRHYSKKFPDGKTRIRKEVIKTPKHPVKMEIKKMNDADNTKFCSITRQVSS